MLKRIFDLLISAIGLISLCPILTIFCLLIFLQDFKSPFYFGKRVGINYKVFYMLKLRSMKVGSDKSGVDSTSEDDKRITKIGTIVRRFKIDELLQLWNVLKGDMSIVGPRPNVESDVVLYTKDETAILAVLPGITDLSSIVFSDEGKILKGSKNPDLRYNQLIRPWKSRLAIFYIENSSFIMDINIILLTVIGLFKKDYSLSKIYKILKEKNVDLNLLNVVLRKNTLRPFPPPGANKIVEFK